MVLRRQPYLHIVLLLVTAILLSGCSTVQAARLPHVDLSQRASVPAAARSELIPLRVAVAAIISPEGTADSYGELIDYLGAKLGRPIQLVQRRTYAEVNELVNKHQVDLAFVCTSAYIDGYDRFGMELLAAPQINGESVYHSQLIVPASSPIQTVEELRGLTFAFTDPMSFTGRVYPTFLVQQLGELPEQFFADTFFTYSHDRAIEAVAAGIAHGAAVDSLVLLYALQRDPTLSAKIRTIHTSPPFGIPPVVVPPDLSPRQKMQLRDILLEMHQDIGGQDVLMDLGIDRFVSIQDSVYDSVRELVAKTGKLP